jgi:hypothetical protein
LRLCSDFQHRLYVLHFHFIFETAMTLLRYLMRLLCF